MIIDESIMSIGIVITGAVIVLITGFLIVKSISNKSTAQGQPLEKIRDKTDLKKKPVPTSEATDISRGSVVGKVTGGIFKGIAALGRRSTPQDQPPVDQGLVVKEQSLTQSVDLTSLGLQANTLSSLVARETLNAEPSGEQEIEGNVIDTVPIEPEQGLPKIEPADEQEIEGNVIDTVPAQSTESIQGPLQEGLEHSEHESEEESREKPKATDDIFDMFKDEMVEESETSKFAAGLDNVDVHDLLGEAQSLVNDLSGHKG